MKTGKNAQSANARGGRPNDNHAKRSGPIDYSMHANAVAWQCSTEWFFLFPEGGETESVQKNSGVTPSLPAPPGEYAMYCLERYEPMTIYNMIWGSHVLSIWFQCHGFKGGLFIDIERGLYMNFVSLASFIVHIPSVISVL